MSSSIQCGMTMAYRWTYIATFVTHMSKNEQNIVEAVIDAAKSLIITVIGSTIASVQLTTRTSDASLMLTFSSR